MTGGVRTWEACVHWGMHAWGHAWQSWSMRGDEGMCGKGGVHGKGACMANEACMAMGGLYAWEKNASGWYASYWNAFLFSYADEKSL